LQFSFSWAAIIVPNVGLKSQRVKRLPIKQKRRVYCVRFGIRAGKWIRRGICHSRLGRVRGCQQCKGETNSRLPARNLDAASFPSTSVLDDSDRRRSAYREQLEWGHGRLFILNNHWMSPRRRYLLDFMYFGINQKSCDIDERSMRMPVALLELKTRAAPPASAAHRGRL